MAVRWRKLCGDLKKEKYCNYINLKMKIVCDIIKIHCRYKKTNYSSNRCSMCVTVLIYHVYVPSGVGVLVCLSVWSSVHLSCLCLKQGGCTSLSVYLIFCTFIMFMSQVGWVYQSGLMLEGDSGEEVALWLLTSLCTSTKREVKVAL